MYHIQFTQLTWLVSVGLGQAPPKYIHTDIQYTVHNYRVVYIPQVTLTEDWCHTCLDMGAGPLDTPHLSAPAK